MDDAFLRLMDEVEAKRSEIRCTKSGAFFRGHSRSAYRLIPSLLRNSLPSETEHNLYHECFARANQMISMNATSWERLAFLQHHGVPTRLLDWTESLGVALFFATLPGHDNPHIWIVNAFLLNRDNKISRQPRILMSGLDTLPDYHECFIKVDDRLPWPYKKPLFLQIPWTSERLRAQSGFFTFHPSAAALETLCPKHARRVDISPDALPGVLKFIELAGITEHTIFPDFVGFAGFLRRRYSL